jgi:hypothetical protein
MFITATGTPVFLQVLSFVYKQNHSSRQHLSRETTEVLNEAAVAGKRSRCRRIENVIVGHRIPAELV